MADFDLIGIFAFNNFQIILIVISLILAFLVLVYVAFIFEHKAEVKNRPLKEKAMSEIASKFGKVVFVSVDALRFELNQTIFDAKFELGRVEFSQTAFSVQFNLPNHQEKFFIQHRSIFPKPSRECQPISLSATPKDFIFHSLNAQYLLSLLEKEKILAELNKYPSDWHNFFTIAFENGVFSLTWLRGGTRNKSKSLQQICQTAVIFYNELSER